MYAQRSNSSAFALLLSLDFQFMNANFLRSLRNSVKQAGVDEGTGKRTDRRTDIKSSSPSLWKGSKKLNSYYFWETEETDSIELTLHHDLVLVL
jgi:hypothetical protein